MIQAGKRYLVLLLGLWIALAPALSAAPSIAMTIQNGMSGEAGYGGNDCCPDGEMARDICKIMCMNTGLYAITAQPGKAIAGIGALYEPQRLHFMHSAASAPDPAPPKSPSFQ